MARSRVSGFFKIGRLRAGGVNGERRSILAGFDFWLILVTALLVLGGLVIVYDASVVQAFRDFGDNYFYIRQQLIWVALGFLCLSFAAFFPYKNYRRVSFPFFVFSLVLLILVLVPGFGFSAGGAHRWLRIGPIGVQPAEIIKLSTILYLATLFERGVRTREFLMVVGGVVFIVGILQRDLGSAIVYFLSSLTLYAIAGAPLKYLLAILPVAVVGFLVFVGTSEYRQKRILAFLDPFGDTQGFSYHITQVLIALGTGGWFGLGIGQSRQKFEFIPEVTTDSIFAIVGEEFGFVGAVALIFLFGFLLYRGFRIADQTEDRFGKLLAYGLVCWLGIQVLVNLGAMVSLIPLTGVPLPFISYGGSALLVNLVAIGILLNISRSHGSR